MALHRKEDLDTSVSNEVPVEDAGGFTRSRKYLKGKSKKASAGRNRPAGRNVPAPVSKGDNKGNY